MNSIALAMFFFWLFCLVAWIQGCVLGFKKAWYVGLLCLVVPLFAEVIAVAHWFGKNLLE